jgi:hypothetical protein
MKNFLILLLVVGVVGYFGYPYLTKGDNPIASFLAVPESLPTRDAEGREVVPCQRCLATGAVTCQASRCKDGQIPCPGRCLKLSDSGWQRMEGQDPNKLFMIYRFNGGSQGVSQAHIGEVFEVRLGKFYNLGVCHTCNKRTTVVCTVCDGTGKVVCPACKGNKVVLKTSGVASPVPKG